jgi:hypothetical protein
VDRIGVVRIHQSVPILDDYAMAVTEQWFYRDDALRLDSQKQFFGVCVKPKEFTKDRFLKQADPNYYSNLEGLFACPFI